MGKGKKEELDTLLCFASLHSKAKSMAKWQDGFTHQRLANIVQENKTNLKKKYLGAYVQDRLRVS